MKVLVKFFASFRQLAGKEEIQLYFSEQTTVAGLKARLSRDFQQIDASSIKPLIAVNAEFASDDVVLNNGDVVAILPPFSGGNS